MRRFLPCATRFDTHAQHGYTAATRQHTSKKRPSHPTKKLNYVALSLIIATACVFKTFALQYNLLFLYPRMD